MVKTNSISKHSAKKLASSRIMRPSRPAPSISAQRRATLARQKRLELIGKRLGIPYPNDDKEPVTFTPKQIGARSRLIRKTFAQTNSSFFKYLIEVCTTNVVHGKQYQIKWLPENAPLDQQYAVLPSDDDLSDYEYQSSTGSEAEPETDSESVSSLEASSDTGIYGFQARTPPGHEQSRAPSLARSRRSISSSTLDNSSDVCCTNDCIP